MMKKTVVRKDLVKRIHVNQANMRANRKDGGRRPVFSVRTSMGVLWGREVEVVGRSKLVYPDKPLSCGARVWIETRSAVIITH